MLEPGTHDRPAVTVADTPSPVGRVVGRFRVERELGRGGMGVVLLARDTDLNRLVAVKLLRETDPETLARFRLEAHALGGLAHPNAVRVFEYGEDSGRPFLALEYVHGRSLHDALRDGPLAPTRAAELLAQIAGAVHAAHQLGIVHRDLKPANVLLDESDTPKLTDFGVARRLAGSDGLTATNIALGTPGYMPPEQAAGQPPDPRTDVYGLGATLYECLTGRPPFVGPTVAVLHQLITADPVPPRRLNAAVPVDLETVCLKCLDKEPGRRYATAEELAADLWRVVRGEPVLARPTGLAGRAVRWTRRHRLPASLLAACVLSLVGGAVGAGWQAVRASRARAVAEQKSAEAEAARRQAEENAAEADAVSRFLRDDLLRQASARAQAEAGFRPDPDLTVRAAVDRAAARLDERFRDRPAAAEAVRLTLALAYDNLGRPEQAVPLHRQAVESRRSRLGPDHPDTLTASLDLALLLGTTGQAGEALELARACAGHRRAALGPDDPGVLEAEAVEANALLRLGRTAEAAPRYEDCLRRFRASPKYGPDHPETAKQLVGLADCHKGQPAERLRLLEEAGRLLRAARGPAHPDVVNTDALRASALIAAGRGREGLELVADVARRRQAALGPTHPDAIWGLNGLGTKLHAAGRSAEVVPVLEEAVRHGRERFGPTHRDFETLAANLATVYQAVGRHADAVPLLAPLWRARAAQTPPHAKTTVVGEALATSLIPLGRFAEAEPLLLARHAALGRAADTPADRLAVSRRRLAELYDAWGKPSEAARWRPERAPPPRPVLGS